MNINIEIVFISCLITVVILTVLLPLLFPLSLAALKAANAVYCACKIVLYGLRIKRLLRTQTLRLALFGLLMREGWRQLFYG